MTVFQAWNNEIEGFAVRGSGVVHRFGRNYITTSISATLPPAKVSFGQRRRDVLRVRFRLELPVGIDFRRFDR